MKLYTLKDAIYDIAEAWNSITDVQIQKSFENVFDEKLFLQIKKEKFQVNDEWVGTNFRGFENQEAISQLNKDTIQTLTEEPSDVVNMDEPTDDVNIDALADNLNQVLSKLTPPQNITAESLREDINFDPLLCLEIDHEITELFSGVKVTEDDEFEQDLLETALSGSNPTPIVNMFSSFTNFQRITNNYASDFTKCDQTLYENLSDQFNQLLLRYVQDPKFTNQVLEDLPDLNQSITSEYINLDNTINVPSTSSQHVTLPSPTLRPSSSIESSTSTTFRVSTQKIDNWKRMKKEPAAEIDSDTNTAELCDDSSTDNLNRFINSPEESHGSSEESDGSTSLRNEDQMSFDISHDDLL